MEENWPCRILQKFSANAYELQLPLGIGISPIFNVADMYPYIAESEEYSSERRTWDTQNENDSWIKQMPPTNPLEIEQILDTQVARRTRRKEYLRYLVKRKGHPIEDSSWLDSSKIQSAGYSIKELMDRGHEFNLPWEPDAGAFDCKRRSLESVFFILFYYFAGKKEKYFEFMFYFVLFKLRLTQPFFFKK